MARWQSICHQKNHPSRQVNRRGSRVQWAHGLMKTIWRSPWTQGLTHRPTWWVVEEWVHIESNYWRNLFGWSSCALCSLSAFCEEPSLPFPVRWSPDTLLCWDLSCQPWGSLAFHSPKVQASFCALVNQRWKKEGGGFSFSCSAPLSLGAKLSRLEERERSFN